MCVTVLRTRPFGFTRLVEQYLNQWLQRTERRERVVDSVVTDKEIDQSGCCFQITLQF
jgi:hypothetical protein